MPHQPEPYPCLRLQDNRIVYGGGAAEMACSIAVSKAADQVTGTEQVRLVAVAHCI